MTVYFIKFVKRLFAITFLFFAFSSWNLHDTRQRFLCTQKRKFSLILQKLISFPVDPHCKNCPLWQRHVYGVADDDEFNFYRATHAKRNILSALPTVTPPAGFNLVRNNGVAKVGNFYNGWSMGKFYVFCHIKLKLRFWLHKKPWNMHTSFS